jgi:hypothetical protein
MTRGGNLISLLQSPNTQIQINFPKIFGTLLRKNPFSSMSYRLCETKLCITEFYIYVLDIQNILIYKMHHQDMHKNHKFWFNYEFRRC